MAIVIVSGALANKYQNGGEAWIRLGWAVGLKRLGFDVRFVEQIRREHCLNAAGAVVPFEESVNVEWFRQLTEQFGLDGATLICENGEQFSGLTRSELTELAGAADLLVNISGHLTFDPVVSRVRRKAYVDEDPGFTQIWHATGAAGVRLDGYDFYFSMAGNIGAADCAIPTGAIRWRPLRPPVRLEHWPFTAHSGAGSFTTVGSWRGPYGPVEYGGRTFGLKVHEFRKFITLPRRVSQTFEIALNIHPADERDLRALREHGWRIIDPKVVASTPAAFRDYVQQSGAEFSVARGIYVETNSGWFSDRTVRYLASGRPALVQDTGFSRNYPVGEGLVPFRTLDEAIAGVKSISGDYAHHARAARALAETYFDSDKVLGRVVEDIGIAP